MYSLNVVIIIILLSVVLVVFSFCETGSLLVALAGLKFAISLSQLLELQRSTVPGLLQTIAESLLPEPCAVPSPRAFYQSPEQGWL